MKKLRSPETGSRRIVFGTTVGLSARALLRGQLAWFRSQGWDVTLVTSPDEDAHLTVEREQISFSAIPMERNISLVRDLKSACEWIRVIRRTSPQVVNVGTPKAGLLGILAAWIQNVPRRIYTVRGLRLEGTSGIMRRVLWVIERLTIAMATDVISISPSLGRELIRHNLVSSHKVWIIGEGSSNGVDTEAIQRRVVTVDRCSLRTAIGIDPAAFVIGYIGRVTHEKGVDTLLAALRSEELDEEVQLLIVGSIEDSTLAATIEEMKDRVHVVEWTDDVWAYLPALDVLCHPSLREGFGNVIIEAAAAGIPAITTRVTGAVDALVPGKTGFQIDVGDVPALVRYINLFANDKKLLTQMGVEAKRRVERDFQPEPIWKGIEAVAEGNYGTSQLRSLDQYMKSDNQ